MRPALFTLTAGLLTAATATAQPVPMPAPPAALPPAVAAGPTFAPAPAGVDLSPTAVAATEVLTADPGRPGRVVWGQAEYLVWFTTPMNMPSVIQTVPSAFASAGAASAVAGSHNVFPKTRQLQFDAQSGLRATAGGYFGPNDDYGLDASYYTLESQSASGAAYTNGLPVAVAQPYSNVATGAPNLLYFSQAGQYAGGLTAFADTQTWGADINGRYRVNALFADRTDFTAGFRFHELDESLTVSGNSIASTGSQLQTLDVVRTRNRFYGHQVGLASRFGACERGLGLDTAVKIGLGGVHQEAQVFGSNTITNPGMAPTSEPLGLYARGGNNGSFSRDRVAFMTDVTTNLTYHFSSRMRVHFGYSLFYLSSVARPGELLNTAINPTQVRFLQGVPAGGTIVPGAPAFRWNSNDYWVQGMNFGARFTY